MNASDLLDVTRPTPHLARVVLNRPDVRNAFDERTIAALTTTFETLSADDSLRAIVLGGHGKAFCAGADLAWMRRIADIRAGDEGREGVQSFLTKRRPDWLDR